MRGASFFAMNKSSGPPAVSSAASLEPPILVVVFRSVLVSSSLSVVSALLPLVAHASEARS